MTALGDTPSAARIAQDLRSWTIEKSLPLWATKGFDAKRGGFQERLNPDGSPDLGAPRRLLVQARQIYVFAHAASLGWFTDGKRLALEAAGFMLEKYRSADGGLVFSLSPDNSVADPRRDSYAHMFVLMALSWTAQVSGDAQLRGALDKILAFVDERLTARDGSLLEGAPPSLPRRQNPHMHGFEAMLAMHETIDHPQALPRATRLLALLNERFIDRATQTIGEYFNDDWTPAAAQGDLVEPGHHAEWAWLIRKYDRLRGAAPGALPAELLQLALRWRDPPSGLLIDEANRDGTIRRSSRRLWPQTELARAFIAEAEIGAADAEENAAATLSALAAQYLDRSLMGGWTDRFDANGAPLTRQMPATAFYHVFGAIADANRLWPAR